MGKYFKEGEQYESYKPRSAIVQWEYNGFMLTVKTIWEKHQN